MCTVARVDAKNFGTTWVPGVARLVESSSQAYIFWLGVDPSTRNNAFHGSEVWVRPLDKTALTLGSAFRVDANDVVGGEDPWDWDGISVCRLDSGVMIAAYGTATIGSGDSVHVKESAANDHTTWGARTVLTAGAFYCTGPISTDGTNCFIYLQHNTTADIYALKRTAANTWALCTTALGGGKIHDASTFSSAGFYNIKPFLYVTAMTNAVQSSATVACMVTAYASVTTAQDQMRCLWTTDGWATTGETIIKNYVGSANTILNTCPRIRLGADGRLRAMWIETNATYGFGVPVLAYSDDMGQTWTVIGTPTVLTTFAWDETFDGAFTLDHDDRMYLSAFDKTDGSNIKHVLFKGGDATTGWEAIVTCEHIELTSIGNVANSTYGEMFVNSEGDMVRVFNGVQTSGSTFFTVNYLLEEGVEEEGGGPPPLVEESPSGSDATNIVLRNRLSTKRGWSAHDWPFSCFAGWPEGDYTTQRRLPIKIAGLSVIDPSVSSPSSLPAIMKFDDPEHYGRERFMQDAGGAVVPRLDPFYAQAHTKAFNLTDDAGVAIVRGVLVSYRRIGATLPVQIWIDGVLVQTTILPETGAQGGPEDVFSMKERFIPLTRLSNVGRTCQLRFEDESLFPFWIEWVAIKKIKKKIRARNQS